MKHFFKLFTTTILVALSAIVLSGCQKGEDSANDALNQGEATLARVMDFKQQLEFYKTNPGAKNSESVSLDEAVWNIEALFNLTYAYPELSYSRTATSDTVLYLPIGTDNTVLLSDLAVFYGQMYEVVSNIYHGIELANKQFIILDVALGERNAYQQALRLNWAQGSVKGIQPPIPQPVMWKPFEDGISWWYGNDLGNSLGYGYGKMDAADTICSLLNAVLVPKAPAGQEYIYTNVLKKELSDEYHAPYSHSFYPGEYCEFFVQNPTAAHYQLNSDQMNFHYYGERHLVLNVLPDYVGGNQVQVPSDYKLFNIVIEDFINETPQNTEIGHHTKAYYGQREIVYHNIIVRGNL